MSISDRIVVMKGGVVQQIGRPQEVYDNPVNLFVAKFLGTPPINVFEGRIEKGRLYIGEDVIGEAAAEDRAVYVAVRPEGFIPSENGVLHCELDGIEVMGRDISILSHNAAAENEKIRAIVSAETAVDLSKGSVAFDLKPNKVFVFDRETEVALDLSL